MKKLFEKHFERTWLIIFLIMFVFIMIPFPFFYSETYIPAFGGIPLKPEYSRDYPALVVELKWNQNAQTAIRQIKNRQYPEAVANYTDNILLVGISYDKKQKTHNCVIEKCSEK